MQERSAITQSSIEGGCLCGVVRYRVSGAASPPVVCHCESRRRACGAQAVAWVTFPTEQFRFVTGRPVEFQSSTPVKRTFCGLCGTSLTYKHTNTPEEIDITTASLDKPDEFSPVRHVWVSEKVGWVDLNDDLPQFERTSTNRHEG